MSLLLCQESQKKLSEYEKIREMNIKERNEALAAAGFDWKSSCIQDFIQTTE